MISCCCCLPTPLTLVCGGSPIIPLLVYQPAYPSIWPAAPSFQRGMSINPGVTMWCVCGCSWRNGVCGCYRGCIMVMDVIWRRLCVSMIWKKSDICLFWVVQECDEWGGEVSLQSCSWRIIEHHDYIHVFEERRVNYNLPIILMFEVFMFT